MIKNTRDLSTCPAINHNRDRNKISKICTAKVDLRPLYLIVMPPVMGIFMQLQLFPIIVGFPHKFTVLIMTITTESTYQNPCSRHMSITSSWTTRAMKETCSSKTSMTNQSMAVHRFRTIKHNMIKTRLKLPVSQMAKKLFDPLKIPFHDHINQRCLKVARNLLFLRKGMLFKQVELRLNRIL